LVFREAGKALKDKWAELIAPHQVYDLLVREHRVCGHTTGAQQYGE
jgi:hypothetical protein